MRQLPTTDDARIDIGALLPGLRAAAAHQACRAVLTRTVEDEVIPRLLGLRQPASRPARQAAGPDRLASQHVRRLVDLVQAGDGAGADAHVGALHRSGVPVETLFLDLLTPVARALGRMWEDDTASFADVSVGVLHLGRIMRTLGRDFGRPDDRQSAGSSVLLAPVPGEQHGFGLAMLAHFFRRAGWSVREVAPATCDGLVESVEREWFGVVGLTAACDERLEGLAGAIRAVRRHSRNRAVGIMVGGPLFVTHPQLAAMVGADATATDAPLAVRRSRGLLADLSARER